MHQAVRARGDVSVEDACVARVQRRVLLRVGGGILLGARDVLLPKYEVVDLTFPGGLDRRGRFHFLRSKRRANKAIRRSWAQSGGKVNYVGEWHTHDEPLPRPSQADRKLIEQIVNDRSLRFDKVFMLIVGNGGAAFVGMASPDSGGSFEDEVIVEWRE